MTFKKLNGKTANVVISKYRVDWKDDSLSNFQWKVKQFFYPYWRSHVVLEEMRLAGTLLRLDFLNITKGIAVECQGGQHIDINHYYNEGDRDKYLAQLKRDMTKAQWCEINGYTLVEIFETDIDNLSEEWFELKYEIKL